MVEDRSERPMPSMAQRVLTDAGAALFIALAVALVLASLSAAGVINMTVAFVLLAIAWTVSFLATFVLGHVWKPTNRERLVFATTLGIALGAVSWYEYQHQPPITLAQPTEASPPTKSSSASAPTPITLNQVQTIPEPSVAPTTAPGFPTSFCAPGTAVCLHSGQLGSISDIHIDSIDTCGISPNALGVTGNGSTSNLTVGRVNTEDVCGAARKPKEEGSAGFSTNPPTVPPPSPGLPR